MSKIFDDNSDDHEYKEEPEPKRIMCDVCRTMVVGDEIVALCSANICHECL